MVVNIKRVFWFSLKILSKTFLILGRIERDIIVNVYGSSCEVPVHFLDRFSKNTQILDFMKIRLVGAELFHEDERTDNNGEANNHFSHFVNTPNKITWNT
jgi:hypothetical protein